MKIRRYWLDAEIMHGTWIKSPTYSTPRDQTCTNGLLMHSISLALPGPAYKTEKNATTVAHYKNTGYRTKISDCCVGYCGELDNKAGE